MSPNETIDLESLSPEALQVCELLWFDAYNIVLDEIAKELETKGLVRIGEVELIKGGRLYRGVIRTFLPSGDPVAR